MIFQKAFIYAHIDGDTVGTKLRCISYKRPVEQVTKLMKLLDLKYAKDVGEYTYDQYIKNNNIK